MESLEGFRQAQRVIEDFTANTLAAIPSDFGRLYYAAALREPATGEYQHEGLKTIYSQGAVQQALERCHAELFLRVLEMPLDRQEWDLRSCLGALDADVWEAARRWKTNEGYMAMVPEGVPEYLGELFSSNLHFLLDLYEEERVSLQGAA